ncbi:MAG TPA: polysaccharide deacetylase family protein [Candidatus Nitrosotenuis sp.]|jgi:peptidoglycan/xylan/chitin deacetylase (PgdA/CDA1 family)|nr:polysaccharide deacetylase family protein [Candidatus Nitrosotenuis sp.]
MLPKSIYLTIDDFPSVHGQTKIDFLNHHQIPAIIYARGEWLKDRLDMAVFAIKKGFLIGNHSYSHPSFSKLALKACLREIEQTEQLIEKAYCLAEIERPLKTIRFPFGDLGPHGLEDYLQKNKFQKPVLPFHLKDKSYSVPWSFDILDYKVKLTQQPSLIIEKLEETYLNSPYCEEIVLAHDFDHNQEAFNAVIQYFLQKKVAFKELQFTPS